MQERAAQACSLEQNKAQRLSQNQRRRWKYADLPHESSNPHHILHHHFSLHTKLKAPLRGGGGLAEDPLPHFRSLLNLLF